jgi:hypothetical protein
MSMVCKRKIIEHMEEMIARLISSWFGLEHRSKKFKVFQKLGHVTVCL